MAARQSPFDLSKCARKNILQLQPYRCARDDYKDDGTNVLLDANENAYGPGLALNSEGALQQSTVNGDSTGSSKPDIDFLGLNRYPDPHQIELKQLFCNLRNTRIHSQKDLTPENLFVGVGSDEAIDALLRCFCVPGKDKILTCPPTYGMYGVSAQVNDVDIVKVPLDVENGFQLQPEKIIETLSADDSIKMVYICSPGNPTANLIRKSDIQKVLEHPTWNGVVVVDEAYIDFAPEGSSLAEWVNDWPNLVVMQTLSKAFGLAGIRLGVAFTSPAIARLLNSLKAPYNISSPTSALAMAALSPNNMAVMKKYREQIIAQRERLLQELPKIPGIGRFLGGQESNFLLVELLDKPANEGGKPSNQVALAAYEAMAEKHGVVVRFRGKELGCEGCLRVTVGTEEEVTRFLQELRVVLGGLLGYFNNIQFALALIRSGRHIGKVVISDGESPRGLCGSQAIHMAWHGARQIIVCSRSGLSDEASQKTIANYSAYGCDIVGAKGDVADMAFLRKMFREAAPALAGVVQGAMIFRDRPYEVMTLDEYHTALYGKFNAISTNVYGLPYMRVTQQISPINPSSSAQLVTGLGFPLPDNSDLIREARFGFFGRITAGMSGVRVKVVLARGCLDPGVKVQILTW
ncbi:Histidinol-phosphate aminotransferase [Aspergillus oryzae]|uniref:histidinol-phosphate transaminase n=5 Tax=Aspergillus subgen. Circumdati TaxID=2720871 RepID=A0A1S9DQ39_ASPOZ|nr:Histidinol-phosphate aminotransferase [Aspergillus oryzae]